MKLIYLRALCYPSEIGITDWLPRDGLRGEPKDWLGLQIDWPAWLYS